MAQTLEKLITEANSVFADGFMLTQYQRAPVNLHTVELLAQYLVAEIRGLYDSRCSDQENLSRIITNLDMALAKIDEVSRCFQELRQALPA